MARTTLQYYDEAVASGDLQHDSAQEALAKRLDHLSQILSAHIHASNAGLLKKLFSREDNNNFARGLYIWGSVGRGKTMLMDCFFETLDVQKKRRVHFHAFMSEVHERIFKERERNQDNDAVLAVAQAISAETKVLCFDELAVTDIADAMILARLFTQLFANGLTVIATSNIAPEDLYKNGLNRPLFEPFIALLRERMDVVRLDAQKDFRLEKLSTQDIYKVGTPEANKVHLDMMWKRLFGEAKPRSQDITIKGRTLKVPHSVMDAARFSFAQLCETPLGSEDYLELAKRFHTLFLDDIPHMLAENRNALRRFINLIDIFYEQHVRLIASAAARPQDLCQISDGYEALAFERTSSRLIEMQSAAYLAAPHSQSDAV